MKIQIIPRAGGGTEFLAQPHRLHLGGRQASGVDVLRFVLPDAWSGLNVTLHIEHADGTLATPIALDENAEVTVDRRFTGWRSGKWMLAATDGADYAAYTRPGVYDVYDVLSTDGDTQDPGPTAYEQFVAQVLSSANRAAAQAQSAAASAAEAQTAAKAVDEALAGTVSSAADLFSVEGETANQKLWNAVNAGGRYSGGSKTMTLLYSDCTPPGAGLGAARYYVAYRDNYPAMKDENAETVIRDTVFAPEGDAPILLQFIYKSGSLTFENCTFRNVLFWFGEASAHKFTFRDCLIEDNQYNFIQCGEWNANAEYLIEGCTFRHMRPDLSEYRADIVPQKLNGWAHGNIRCLGYDVKWTIRDTLFEDCMGRLNIFFGKSSHADSVSAERVKLYMERCTIRQTNGAGVSFSGQPVTGWIRGCNFSDIGANRCNGEGYDLPADAAVHSGSGTAADPYVYACGVGGNAIFSYNSTPRHELVISNNHMARMMENGVEGNYREVSFNHIEQTGYRIAEGLYTPSTEGIYGNICVCKGNVVRAPGAQKAAIVIPRGFSDGQPCFYEDNLLVYGREDEASAAGGIQLAVSTESFGYELTLKNNTIRGFAKKYDILNPQLAALTGVRIIDAGEDDDVLTRADFYQNSLLGVHYEAPQGKSIAQDADFREVNADGSPAAWTVLYGTGKVYTTASCERFVRVVGNSKERCALLAQDFRLGAAVYLARVRCSVRSSSGKVGFAPYSVDNAGNAVSGRDGYVFNPQMAVLEAPAEEGGFCEVTHTMAVTQNCRICILNPSFDDAADAAALSQMDVKDVEITLTRCLRAPAAAGDADESGTQFDFSTLASAYAPANTLRVRYYLPGQTSYYTGTWPDATWMMGKHTGGEKGRGRVVLTAGSKQYTPLDVWYASDFDLELNGFTLECANTEKYGFLQLFNGAKVTIKGPGVIKSVNCALTVAPGCSCTVTGGTEISSTGTNAVTLSEGGADGRASLTLQSAAVGKILAGAFTDLRFDVPDADSAVSVERLQTGGSVTVAANTKLLNNGVSTPVEITTVKQATGLFSSTSLAASYTAGHTSADLTAVGDESSVEYSYLDANGLLVSKSGTLTAALSAASSTRTTRTGALYIRLNGDAATYSGFYCQNVGALKLNLNGYAITSEYQSYALYFTGVCNALVYDSGDRGEDTGLVSCTNYSTIIANGASCKLELNGGTIRQKTGNCLHAENGAQVTLSGAVKLEGKVGADVTKNAVLTVSGGEIAATSMCVQATPADGATTAIIVHGGTMTSDNITIYAKDVTFAAVQGAAASMQGKLSLTQNAAIGENTVVTVNGTAQTEVKNADGLVVVSYTA